MATQPTSGDEVKQLERRLSYSLLKELVKKRTREESMKIPDTSERQVGRIFLECRKQEMCLLDFDLLLYRAERFGKVILFGFFSSLL